VINASFTALNSVQVGGIHVATGGNNAITGTEATFTVDFVNAMLLNPDHYFMVAQVQMSSGSFYWLSGSRPIAGTGTTSFAPDLQAWVRDANLDPDWLRVGTDIVGGTTPPTFNLSFAVVGTIVPEPSTSLLMLAGLGVVAYLRSRHRR
jgi:hypothetical protein